MGIRKERSLALRYIAALLAPAIAVGVTQLTWPLFEQSPVSPFLLAVAFSAWYGGLNPGLISLFISILMADYFFIAPYFSLGRVTGGNLEDLLTLAALGVFMSVLSEWMHRQTQRAETNLATFRASEERYRKLAENFPSGAVVTYDRDLRVTFIGGKGLNEPGRTRDFYIGKLLDEIAPPDLVDIAKGHFLAAFDGQTTTYECAYPDGRSYSCDVAPLLNGNGRVNEILVIAHEITERKRAEGAIREAERKYRDIFENAGEGIFQTTPEGQYIEVNPALARMHGYDSPEELILDRKDISREVYVDPARREEFKHVLEAQGFVRGFEHQIFRRDGSKIWVSVNAHVVRDDQGKILYYEGTTQDINERKLAEARSAVFAALARKLTGATTKLQAARIIAESARELFGWDSCTVDLYDAERDVIHPMLKVDTIDGRRVDVSSPGEQKPTARTRRVLDHGPELLLREDPVQFDSDAIPFGDMRKASASIMTVPVLRAARIVGVLSIQSYQPRAYNAAALNDLQSLADHCGEAINRIHAEESFYESEERFRQLANHFEDVVWLTDKDVSKVLYINPAYERIFRRTSESLHQRLETFLDKIHPDDRVSVERRLENERQGVYEPAEYRIIWPDGSVRWILRRSFPIRNTEGKIHLVAGIAQDITERKRAEESMNLFRKLIDQSSDAIEVIDPVTLRFIDCNESAHQRLGYSRDEFLSLTAFDVDPMLTRDTLAQLDDLMKATGFATQESIHRRKNGTTFPVEISVKLVKLERVYRLAVVRDITSRKQVEEALRESEERYRELFENAKDAIYVHDLSGRYVSVNRAAEKLSGYTREEILGKHYSNFVSPRHLKDARANLCQKLDLENETVYEVLMVTKDRQSIPVEISSRLIYENGVAVGVQGIARDVTDRKRAQEALKTYSRGVIEAQESERQHIARELHDEIGQVLTAVKINLQSIQRLSPSAAWMPPLDESIDIVDEALGRVRELSIELRPALLDDLGLSAALRWYVDRCAQRTGIVAEIRNGFEDEGRLPRDLETACFRIAQEALTNVVRHAKAAHVAIQLDRSREKVLLTITDDGVGFDVQGALRSPSAAAALGLRGMEERVTALRGKIEIESVLQKGTCVRATLPLQRKQ
jgi:PAS domain S-box-containing protein